MSTFAAHMEAIESSLSLRPISGTAEGRPYLAISPAPPTLQTSTMEDTQIIRRPLIQPER